LSPQKIIASIFLLSAGMTICKIICIDAAAHHCQPYQDQSTVELDFQRSHSPFRRLGSSLNYHEALIANVSSNLDSSFSVARHQDKHAIRNSRGAPPRPKARMPQCLVEKNEIATLTRMNNEPILNDLGLAKV
jgi:hypothetical protein